MKILGIETSCDETAAAVVEGELGGTEVTCAEILSNIVLSQKDHAAFGGVVPEIAARAHLEALDETVLAALKKASCTFQDLDAIAATSGPGLIGGLIVGMTSAKAMAYAHNLPFIGINHLEGHALTARLSDKISYPYMLLLVSGGHSQILLIKGLGQYERLGTTIDDALGEAFDKSAKLLGLGYPGGPNVEKAALTGDAERFILPKPLLGTETPNFSFSGLKSAFRRQAEQLAEEKALTQQDISDLCASFQRTVSVLLVDRLGKAYENLPPDMQAKQMPLVVAGGVAANLEIRSALTAFATQLNVDIICAPLALCGDNGAMIAWAGLEHFSAGTQHGFDYPPHPRWPLDQHAAAVGKYGKAGRKA